MKWIIKNPAPTDWRQEKWGDFHFGRSLTKYLEKLGQSVSTHYFPEWEKKEKQDVVLVLRGKHEYEQIDKEKGVKIMWNISHPDDVKIEEYAKYDIVLIASQIYADKLKREHGINAIAFLQCTDHEEFYYIDKNDEKERRDIIFVGNTRDIERKSVIFAISDHVDLKVWGRGWKEWIDSKYIKGSYIDNKELGLLYNKARVTLNDHWDDMKENGFINNRIFDALSCGLPIISDYHQALHELFPEGILYYNNEEEFKKCIEKVLFEYPSIIKKIKQNREVVLTEYTFKRRAEQLLDIVQDLKYI